MVPWRWCIRQCFRTHVIVQLECLGVWFMCCCELRCANEFGKDGQKYQWIGKKMWNSEIMGLFRVCWPGWVMKVWTGLRSVFLKFERKSSIQTLWTFKSYESFDFFTRKFSHFQQLKTSLNSIKTCQQIPVASLTRFHSLLLLFPFTNSLHISHNIYSIPNWIFYVYGWTFNPSRSEKTSSLNESVRQKQQKCFNVRTKVFSSNSSMIFSSSSTLDVRLLHLWCRFVERNVWKNANWIER